MIGTSRAIFPRRGGCLGAFELSLGGIGPAAAVYLKAYLEGGRQLGRAWCAWSGEKLGVPTNGVSPYVTLA